MRLRNRLNGMSYLIDVDWSDSVTHNRWAPKVRENVSGTMLSSFGKRTLAKCNCSQRHGAHSVAGVIDALDQNGILGRA
jgi:hypothetical protein